MTERLIIRNFAGLEEVDIELGRINIFIGPQASGKSVCAKCLYWFKSFLPDLLASAATGQERKPFEKAFLERFKEYFPGIWRTDDSLFLRYEVGNTFIQIQNTFYEAENADHKLLLTYDEVLLRAAHDIRGTLNSLKEKYIKPGSKTQYGVTELEFLFEEHSLLEKIKGTVYEQVGEMMNTHQLFILAGRSFFTALKGAALSFLATAPVVDPFLRSFIGDYELRRRHQPDANAARIQALWALAKHILKGKILIEGDEDFVIDDNGRQVKLANASSGQQEAFALVLLLINLVSDEDDIPEQGPYTIYVEEPEAHLYPDSQWAMVQLMASVYHESVFSLQYIITTHSPYLLSTFNNLIRAHQLAERFKDDPAKLKVLYRIIPKNQQLALDNFRVYALADGKAHSIISAEDGLIVADKLDEVSERISQQFDKLLHLEAQAAANEKAS